MQNDTNTFDWTPYGYRYLELSGAFALAVEEMERIRRPQPVMDPMALPVTQ